MRRPVLPSPRTLLEALTGLLVLTGLWALGEGLVRLLPAIPLTGSLWGMTMLFALLSSGLLPEARVRLASAALIRVLGLLFVPVGVGIVAFGPLVVEHALAIVVAIVVGSVATVLAVAGAAGVAGR